MNQDRERLAQAVERYGDMVYRVALQRLRGQADAEDVTQEAFLRLMRAPEILDGDAGREKAWLLRVTVNLCKDHQKSAWSRRVGPLPEALPASLPEETSGVLEALSALPAPHRDVLCLYYIEGYSVAETARLLGRSEGTVCSALARARKKLKTLLEEVG